MLYRWLGYLFLVWHTQLASLLLLQTPLTPPFFPSFSVWLSCLTLFCPVIGQWASLSNQSQQPIFTQCKVCEYSTISHSNFSGTSLKFFRFYPSLSIVVTCDVSQQVNPYLSTVGNQGFTPKRQHKISHMWFLTSKNLRWNFPWSYHQNNYCITKYCTSKIQCFCFKLFALCWGLLSDMCLWCNEESLTARSELPQRSRNELLVSFLQLQATGSNWQQPVERALSVDNSPYLATICHAINFFITGVYLWALIHQLSICPHPETANRAQVCYGFTREDCFPSFPQWTAVAKMQPLALQMCSVTRQSQKVFNSYLPDHNFTAKDNLSFVLYPILTFAVPSPPLKHLKQQL